MRDEHNQTKRLILFNGYFCMRRNFTTLHSINRWWCLPTFAMTQCFDSKIYWLAIRYNHGASAWIQFYYMTFSTNNVWIEWKGCIEDAYVKMFVCFIYQKSHSLRVDKGMCWQNEFPTKKPDRNWTAHLSLNYY